MKYNKKIIPVIAIIIAVIGAAVIWGIAKGEEPKTKQGGTEGQEEEEREAEKQAGKEDQTEPENITGQKPIAESETDAGEDEKESDQIDEAAEARLRKKLAEMTTAQKVAQMFVITPEALTGVDTATRAGEQTRKSINDYPAGGLIYMAGSLITPEQTKEMLTNTMRYSMETVGVPIFLAVDEEGGSVARVASNPEFGVENVGNMSAIGKTRDSSKAYDAGAAIGSYLHDLGFNVDFAPVADVLTNEKNQVVARRSFGNDAGIVSDMVEQVVKALTEQNVISCIKHFPGHGATTGDTHEGMEVVEKTWDELKQEELLPFVNEIRQHVPMIMVGHFVMPDVTGDTPCSLSEAMVTGKLREELGYNGVIITDALDMQAIVKLYGSVDAAVMAIHAGVDLLLIPEDFKEAYNGVLEAVQSGEITEGRIDESVMRILRLKDKMLMASDEWEDVTVKEEEPSEEAAAGEEEQPEEDAAGEEDEPSEEGATNKAEEQAEENSASGAAGYADSEKIYLNDEWEFADESMIHTGYAVLYTASENRKNLIIGVNAGHGTSGGANVSTYCHPDHSAKTTGGSTAAGSLKATAVSGGMSFYDGTRESTVTLKMARILRDKLLAEGYDVLMIRDGDDVQLDNVARTVMCNNVADCHIALHWDGDGLDYDKGCFYCSVPDGIKSIYPVSDTWKKDEALGEALITGLSNSGAKIYRNGSMDVDLTQTSYSSVPSVDIELGNASSAHDSDTLGQLAEGLLEGINLYFGQGK